MWSRRSIISVFAGIALLGCVGVGYVVYNSSELPAVAYQAPVIESPLSRISSILKDHPEDAARLSALYLALSDILSRDDSIVKTTGQIREAHSRSGRLLFQKTSMRGKYVGLSEAVDEFLIQSLGSDDVILTLDIRSAAVSAFTDLSTACSGDTDG
tara:strand:- start:2245 stop:2712 length:468 start_codon:yes stop_codon:yes gene_type:complete